jgi:hypothetical protein
MRKTSRFVIAIVAAAVLISSVGCSRITQGNYEKIQTGMTMEQTISLLGEPTSVESINFAGISGASATWKNKNATIVIQFLNDQVKIKTLNKSDDDAQSSSTEINLNNGGSN